MTAVLEQVEQTVAEAMEQITSEQQLAEAKRLAAEQAALEAAERQAVEDALAHGASITGTNITVTHCGPGVTWTTKTTPTFVWTGNTLTSTANWTQGTQP